ncbi:hypothetical protein CKAN_02191100 [Cinnamomum micranthum f. kanehirae]|uniref:Uncharacterized protein n=1 Tax=Cinnamomum micranthum f. kanehirae TaxID=337451 RepID=A0A3S3N5F7_9MAGN|nr:hypothetical protein CKAN_02191100 [Cinnamomum micranthum f. kanehirae]
MFDTYFVSSVLVISSYHGQTLEQILKFTVQIHDKGRRMPGLVVGQNTSCQRVPLILKMVAIAASRKSRQSAWCCIQAGGGWTDCILMILKVQGWLHGDIAAAYFSRAWNTWNCIEMQC